MSERKVLNKYYPPDFDPSKIPRLRLPKNRQYTVRLMSPCNMRCNTCGDYIAKGKKFNARKETVETESYLGLKIFRFYFKCPRCMAEITFKTDPKSMDYEVEYGATPNFKALKLAEQQAEAEAKEKEEEEKLNPMKLLENRTKASRREMENLEALEDLKEINQRQININYETILEQKRKDFDEMMKRQEEEDEAFVRSVFPKSEDGQGIANRELPDSDGDSDDESLPKFGVGFSGKSTDLFSADDSGDKKLKLSNKRKLSDMIIVKKKLTPQVENGDNNRDKSVLNSNLSLNKSLLCSYSDSDSNE